MLDPQLRVLLPALASPSETVSLSEPVSPQEAQALSGPGLESPLPVAASWQVGQSALLTPDQTDDRGPAVVSSREESSARPASSHRLEPRSFLQLQEERRLADPAGDADRAARSARRDVADPDRVELPLPLARPLPIRREWRLQSATLWEPLPAMGAREA